MGFFDIFRKSVKKTKQSLSLELDSFSGKITFDTLEELEEILILADVGVTTAGKICSRLVERIKRRNIDSTELRENLCEIVTELMEPDEPLVTETKPSVVLVVGVNGVGKTTSIGKLAQNFIGMATWMDPLRETGFVQNWTIFYWAYWMASVGRIPSTFSKPSAAHMLAMAVR